MTERASGVEGLADLLQVAAAAAAVVAVLARWGVPLQIDRGLTRTHLRF